MKTILIKFDNSFFVRNFLRTDAFRILSASPDIRMVFLAPQEKCSYYQKEFSSPNAVFDVLPESRFYAAERFFRFVETSSIHTHTATLVSRTDFVRAKGQKSLLKRLCIYGMRRVLWRCGQFKFFRACIRGAYTLLPSRTFAEHIKRYQPDLVFCPSMLYTDARLLKEAKKQNIPTLGMVATWDNLYSKTLFRSHPDWLIAHTEHTRDQAVRYGDYPYDRIFISGVPQYDQYFRQEGIIERDVFIKHLGGDPAKKLIVYAGSGKVGHDIDFGIIEMVRDAAVNGEIIQPIEILMRPHPRYDYSQEKIERIRATYGCLLTPIMSHVGGGKDSWEFDAQSMSLLINTLAHADVVIALYTTFFIEAALFNKPIIAVAFDRKPVSYWDSAKRFFEWDHLRELDTEGGIWKVRSRDEMIKAINMYIEHPSHLEEGRRRIVHRQSQYTDGRSGQRLADIILRVLSFSQK